MKKVSKKQPIVISVSSEEIEQQINSAILTDEQVDSIVTTLNGPVEEKEVLVIPEVVVIPETQLVNYTRWSNNSDHEVTFIGVVTLEDEDSVTILTKSGEVTLFKNDGLFEPSNRDEFEAVVIPVKEEVKLPVGTSKMDRATAIFVEMSKDATNRRIDIINKFRTELDMSMSGASTYHQSIKVKLQKQS